MQKRSSIVDIFERYDVGLEANVLAFQESSPALNLEELFLQHVVSKDPTYCANFVIHQTKQSS
jgi:hypothetical protein